jgi:hypothetical protein
MSEMKRWLLLALALTVMPLMGQPSVDPNERIQKLVTLKYADPESVRRLLGLFGVDMTADSRMRVLALSGPRNKIAAAEDAIKQLDLPSAAQKDIELMVYFVVGTDRSDYAPPQPANQPYGTIPADLQSTVATLKTTFPFKTYYLLDALSLRTRSGTGASTSGQLSGGRFSTFRVQTATLEGDGTILRLDRLYAGLRIPRTTGSLQPSGDTRKTEYTEMGVNTDLVSAKEGQKLVIGRSSLDGPSTALFLVLVGKVVN